MKIYSWNLSPRVGYKIGCSVSISVISRLLVIVISFLLLRMFLVLRVNSFSNLLQFVRWMPCVNQFTSGVLLKMLKYFEGMLNIFELSPGQEIQHLDWSMQIRFCKLPSYTLWLGQQNVLRIQGMLLFMILRNSYIENQICILTKPIKLIALVKNRWKINLGEFKIHQKYFVK